LTQSSDAAVAIHGSFLVWRRFLYAKWAILLCAVSLALYLIDRPVGPANGGSYLGYTLGTIGFGLIVWLAWFGFRRRRYGGSRLLEGILSAHVYLGLALIVVATLHTGFHFHWNVHTLAYVLMVLVIGSGAFGAYAFWRYPELMTANRAGATLSTMSAELAALDLRCRSLALAFPDDIVALVETVAGSYDRGRGVAKLSFRSRQARIRALSTEAIARVQKEMVERRATPVEVLPLVQSLQQRLSLVERLNRDQLYRTLLLQWRAVHVPLTVGLVVALTIHVIVVFYDW
jgi:hypothetical protein